MVGGIIGALLLGLLAEERIGGVDGLFFGNPEQFLRQIISVVIAIVWAFGISYILAKIIDATIGLRVTEEEEQQGLDLSLHGEKGYILTD